jgi:hypothetical protein
MNSNIIPSSVEVLHQQIQDWIVALTGSVTIDEKGIFLVRDGSTTAFVSVFDFGEIPVVSIFSPVILNAPPNDQLFEVIAKTDFIIGHLQVATNPDTTVSLTYEHRLFGSAIQQKPLDISITAILVLADQLTQEYLSRFGGIAFTTEDWALAKSIQAHRDHIRKVVTNAIGPVLVASDETLGFTYGTAVVSVAVVEPFDDWPVVDMIGVILNDLKGGKDLFRSVVSEEPRVIGRLSLYDDSDGTLALVYSHRMFADFVSDTDLVSAISFVAETANELTDHYMARFGGQTPSIWHATFAQRLDNEKDYRTWENLMDSGRNPEKSNASSGVSSGN